jgi:hypothetical protein
MWRCAALLIALAAALPSPAAAQGLPSAPVTVAGGRLTISGEASVAAAPADYEYFNYSAGAYDLLRLVRADGSAAFKLDKHVTLLGDVRVEGSLADGQWRVFPHALFARVRPWSDRQVDIQAGLIPPVFGAFSARAYGNDNPLIGFPLAYQYLTSLRADAIPASADDLLIMRGRGWRVRYPVGDPLADHGLPLVDGLQYPAGVEVHAGGNRIEGSVALTTSSLARPLARDLPQGPQLSGRFVVRPVVGLVLGVSAASGAFLTSSLTDTLAAAGEPHGSSQRALGFDAEYSRGYWIVRAEGVFSNWRLPALQAPAIDGPLRSFGLDVEARYRLRPGLYVAARAGRIGFSELTGSLGRMPWDAPVTRIEVGGGYAIRRNLIAKAVYQYNWRDMMAVEKSGRASAQLLFWF